jgi:hypothetical protein
VIKCSDACHLFAMILRRSALFPSGAALFLERQLDSARDEK